MTEDELEAAADFARQERLQDALLLQVRRELGEIAEALPRVGRGLAQLSELHEAHGVLRRHGVRVPRVAAQALLAGRSGVFSAHENHGGASAHHPPGSTGRASNALNRRDADVGTRPALHRRMDRETVAARLGEAERELRAAQTQHDGTHAATVRYQAARARLVQLERLVRVLLET